MGLRLATLEDHDQIFALAKEFAKEAPYPNMKLDDDVISANIVQLLTKPQNEAIIILSIAAEENIVGYLCGVATPTMYSRDRLAAEVGLYIHPDYRKGTSFIKLIDAYEYWAKLVGCKNVTMANIDNPYMKQLGNFYTRRGYTKSEETYSKEL